ncbi:superoxide dismutase family protein [Altererythrobacter sp. KTW20L]|uniref:superoxide dismutase family protein n=1 Tax=Altererythrobacter sp. KTW20L TaxID=2942210 RepID=UPI0020C14DDD|nr:superoxide dismutase family protein [Altererythrobacter sp. KTW20L]MCL6252030.1 superoxide dismutase family protein [Altererythrobacter sp. KTW20L]
MRITVAPAALLAALPLFALAACGGSEPADDAGMGDDTAMMEAQSGPQNAMATLLDADGNEVGTVTATGSGGGVTIDLTVMGLEPGMRGVHIHETGSCSPDFSAAGGHWNPAGMSHGLESEGGQHAGDMPNLEVGADGTGTLSYMLSMEASFEGLMDADGSAFVIHAGEDDQTTDPSGNSGDRIACGVFEAA